ncbi:hypothetical protein [Mycolicibacterium thermoresistibile]
MARPWWEGNPEIAELGRRALAELEVEIRRTEVDDAVESGPDPVVGDFYSAGAAKRELAAARDGLIRARSRYADAVHTARACGYSWGEIAHVLGVSRQVLHRRFRADN